jgi:UDP-N-acetylmuramyl pentapeptide phosphotransferase/UDP-N-acetylglucosamine-1-phosphate transferase
MTHYAPLIAALATLLAIRGLLSSKVSLKIQDMPNERSLHVQPIPRIGGVALMAGILIAWGTMFTSLVWWVILPTLLLFTVSLLDDMHSLPVRQRLLAHGLAALLLVLGSGIAAQNILLALLLLPGVVWMTNLYNFMDGSDGLAGGMALFGFTCYGLAALMHGDESQAMLNFSIAAAALGFLFYNLYPAKVFMGDAGSIPLGFLVAAMGVWGWQQGDWPAWFPVLVFFPFIMDSTVTLVKRSLRGAKVTEAHREHYYQRLVRIGWGHRKVAFFAYVLMFTSGASALWSVHHSPELPWPLFLMWVSIYFILMSNLDSRWNAAQRNQHE